MDVAAWLRSLELEEYAAAFEENAIDAAILPKLSAEDLRDIGVTRVGHRRKLLDAIAALNPAPARQEAPAPQVAANKRGEPIEPGERRQVTVLFADLAGYTRLSTELDAEELHALRSSFTQTIDNIVLAHGGTIERHIGDCVMAVFGAPVAHGNDPERAVYAALAVRDAMPGLTERFGRPVGVHIGVASGEVVAASGAGEAFTVTGESVNLASRLTAHAPTGEILVSAAVQRALADRLDCAALGALPVKGFEEPIAAWRVIAMREARADEGRPLIGRQSELRQLAAAVQACIDTGRGQSIYIRGEAGIGKTRLVEEFERVAAASGFACHHGLVLDFGAGSGRDAVRALVRSILGVSHRADRARRAEKAAGSPPAGADPGAILIKGLERLALVAEETEPHRLAFLYDLLNLPQPRELRTPYDAMDNATRLRGARETAARLAASASRAAPLLLVIEDIHWADRATLEVVSALAEVAAENRVLLAVTSRLEGDPLARGWRLGGPLLTIDLAPLRRDEAMALAASFLDTASAFAAQCVERAAGNPLFLEQLVRHAEERAEDGVPDSVQSLVQARIDRLDPIDKHALQAAAVFGQCFSIEAVRRLLANPGYDPGGLIASFLVKPQDEDFLFGHALIRDAVYATLLHSRRRELHRAAAAWFAERDLALHAEHLDRAEDAAAPRAYLAAAQAECGNYRYERALTLCERGYALARDPAERSALTCQKGELLLNLGMVAEAKTAFEAALAGAPDDRLVCRALIGLVSVQRLIDDIAGAFANLEKAEAIASRLDMALELARIHFLRGNAYFPRGDFEGCVREHTKCLEIAQRIGSAELEAEALGGLGDAELMRGRMLSAHDWFSRCLALACQHGVGRVAVAIRPLLAITRWYRGETAEALIEVLSAVDAAAKVGHRRAEAIAQLAAVTCRISLMELEAGEENATAALALFRQLGSGRFEAHALAFRGEVRRLLGRSAAALTDLRAAAVIMRERDLTFMKTVVLGLLALATDDRVEKEALLREGEEQLARTKEHNNYLFQNIAIEVCIELGDLARAERHADDMESFARAEPSPWTKFHVARARALIAYERGRRDAELVNELERLASDGARMGYKSGLPRLEAALADLRASRAVA